VSNELYCFSLRARDIFYRWALSWLREYAAQTPLPRTIWPDVTGNQRTLLRRVRLVCVLIQITFQDILKRNPTTEEWAEFFKRYVSERLCSRTLRAEIAKLSAEPKMDPWERVLKSVSGDENAALMFYESEVAAVFRLEVTSEIPVSPTKQSIWRRLKFRLTNLW